jgi:septum formation protein
VSTYTVILASASPRRKDLLQQLGIDPVIIPADIDETPHAGEIPTAFASRMAKEKAYAIARAIIEHRMPGYDTPAHPFAVIGADTVVDLDGQIFGKPIDDDDARRMLRALSGRTHRVHTAVVVVSGMGEAFPGLVTSLVTMAPITDQLLAWYIATGEPHDKAGSYAIQGNGGVLVDKVQGPMSNVVGLPLSETVSLLNRAGCQVSAPTDRD